MDPLFSTPPLVIRGTSWRFAIRAEDGRGAYQWRRTAETWRDLATYPHRAFGLVTLAELDRALYQPNRESIAQARKACAGMGQAFELATQHSSAQSRLI